MVISAGIAQWAMDDLRASIVFWMFPVGYSAYPSDLKFKIRSLHQVKTKFRGTFLLFNKQYIC